MGRGALRWTVKELGRKAGIDSNTVVRFENGRHKSNEATMRVIRQAFEAAGLLFIDADETAGAGVREKRATE
jgi:transcriptional regulator with XRE-family HTH domain